jgi:hypothetical protein
MDMASIAPPCTAPLELLAMSPAGATSEGVAQLKLSRLLELRAVIDSIRCETEAHDPLLSWVIAREKTTAQPLG